MINKLLTLEENKIHLFGMISVGVIRYYLAGKTIIYVLVIGGLLSSHLLAKRMNIPVDNSWPCSGPLLDLAVALADKLLPGNHYSHSSSL